MVVELIVKIKRACMGYQRVIRHDLYYGGKARRFVGQPALRKIAVGARGRLAGINRTFVKKEAMEYRQLGRSGIRVPVLSFGTGTFGGGNEFFKAWGSTQVEEATRMVGLCLDAGVNLFDTANVYSTGAAEEILGRAIKGRRDKVLISTKATFPMSNDVNEYGSSRYFLIKACEDSLKRLGVDHVDIYHMHGFDANTPVEETLSALDRLVQDGKVR
jgi:aryl-alcohol dehydrogenase-like predicted oxidoreductase